MRASWQTPRETRDLSEIFGGIRWKPFLRITGAIVLTYLPFAAWMSVPLAGDQKACLSTALEMNEARSTLIPLLFGEPCYSMPPLAYWATIAGIRQWGFSLFGALLPSVLSAWLAAVALSSIAARLWPERDRAQERSGIWFLSSLGTATFGLVAQAEIHGVALLLLAWWLALEHLEKPPASRRRNPWALYAAWAVAGLGALVQGPLLTVFWAMGFWIYLALNGEGRLIRGIHHGLGVILAAALGGAWYLAMFDVDGTEFVARFPWRGTAMPGVSVPELWQALLAACLPWAPIALLGLLRLHRCGSRRIVGFVLGSTIPAAAYFTVSGLISRKIGVPAQGLYLLVPALALLAAWIEAERGKGVRETLSITAALVAFMAAYVAWVGIRAKAFPAWMILLTIGLAALWIWSIFRPRQWVVAALALVAWYHLAGVSLGERDLRGLRRFAEGNPHRGLSMLDDGRSASHEVGLLSLAVGRPIERLQSIDEVLDALEEGQAVVLSASQSETYGQELREGLKDMEDIEGTEEGGQERPLEVVRWRRISTKSQMPWGELLRGRRRLEFERDFQIITLPPDMGREVPEGGV